MPDFSNYNFYRAAKPPKQNPQGQNPQTGADAWAGMLAQGHASASPGLVSTSAGLAPNQSKPMSTDTGRALPDRPSTGSNTSPTPEGGGANAVTLNMSSAPHTTRWDPRAPIGNAGMTNPGNATSGQIGTVEQGSGQWHSSPYRDRLGTQSGPGSDPNHTLNGAGAGTSGVNGGGNGTFSLSGDADTKNMWEKIQSDFDKSLGGQLQQTYADEARAGRSADVQGAMLGRGVAGGGYQAGQAQVALGGMQQRQDVMNQHIKQGLQMKLTYLETLIKRAEAAKDRNLQEKLQAEADQTLLDIQGGNVDTAHYTNTITGSS